MATRKTKKTQIVTITSQQDKEKKKVKGNNNQPYIPIDVFSHILIRVPATSVYNFRFVQKRWRDLICSDPHFTQAHLLQAKQDPGWIMEKPNPLKGKGWLDTYWMKLVDGEFITQHINFSHHTIVTVLASCNGLLLVKKVSTLYVINPITKQQMKLPHHGVTPYYSHDRYALVYIPSIEKYKVLIYFLCDTHLCQILTLGFDSWNKIDGLSEYVDRYDFTDHSHISLNGIVYWKMFFTPTDEWSYILSTDASTEKFQKINLPEDIQRTNEINDFLFESQLVESKGYLAYMSVTESKRFSEKMCIWILEDLYNGIWIKHHVIDLSYLRERNVFRGLYEVSIKPVTTLQEGKVIIFVELRSPNFSRFIALDIESSKIKFTEFMENVRKNRWMPHIMTLVPPPMPELMKRRKRRVSARK